MTLSEFSKIEGVDAGFAGNVTPPNSLPLLVFGLCVPTPESSFWVIDVLASPVLFSGAVVVCFFPELGTCSEGGLDGRVGDVAVSPSKTLLLLGIDVFPIAGPISGDTAAGFGAKLNRGDEGGDRVVGCAGDMVAVILPKSCLLSLDDGVLTPVLPLEGVGFGFAGGGVRLKLKGAPTVLDSSLPNLVDLCWLPMMLA